MSVRELPLQPSLRHLKNESKQLHKALHAGDVAAAARVRTVLPRLSADAAVDDVTLMEAQHVLAREYGFREWPDLAAVAELDFAGLATLSDEDTHRLLREVDQKDLVVALQLAGDDVKRRMLTGMSERVRTFITDEMEFLGPRPKDEILEVQGRILHQVRLLARDGVLGWPPGADTPPPKPRQEPDLDPGLAAIVGRRLTELSVDEVRALVHDLSARHQEHGLLSLETAATAAVDGFVREGLRLAVDGTEPALLEDFLKTRARALLQHLQNWQQVIFEGVIAICSGDNPRFVAHKLLCVYRIDYDAVIEPTGATIDELGARLRTSPVSAMDLDGLATLLTDLSQIARRQGVAALAPLADVIDDAVLREGVRRLADLDDMTTIGEAFGGPMKETTLAVESRLRLFTAGITALQRAKKGPDLDAAMDAALSAD